jgi:hypothetical protein
MRDSDHGAFQFFGEIDERLQLLAVTGVVAVVHFSTDNGNDRINHEHGHAARNFFCHKRQGGEVGLRVEGAKLAVFVRRAFHDPNALGVGSHCH